MKANDADRLTGSITTVGACTAGAALLGGSLAGVAGALIGTIAGLILGILVARGQRNRAG